MAQNGSSKMIWNLISHHHLKVSFVCSHPLPFPEWSRSKQKLTLSSENDWDDLDFDDVGVGPASEEGVELVDQKSLGRWIVTDLGQVGLLGAVHGFLLLASQFGFIELEK